MTDPKAKDMTNGELAFAVEFAAKMPTPLRLEYAEEIAARLRAMDWQPIESAPRDGTPIDLWCADPYGEFEIKIRLANCSWHDADEIFPHTGWIRVTDDGNYDLVESGPTSPYGLPAWKPTHWQPLPPPPEQ